MKKLLVVLALFSMVNAYADPFRDAISGDEGAQLMQVIKALHDGGQPDCNSSMFKSPNSPRTLIGWSTPYHKDLVAAVGYENGENNTGAITATSGASACYRALKYRGAAVCLKPKNESFQQKFKDTIDYCYKLGFE